MQYTSDAYRESMKKLARNRSYMKINIGLINQDAQGSAEVEPTGYARYANIQAPIDGEEVTKRYATYEPGYTKADGKKYFLPRDGTIIPYYNAGIVTDGLFDNSVKPSVLIHFRVPDPLDIKGLTIQFGESYPTKIMVETDEKKVEFENDAELFRTEETFDGCTYMRITAEEMLNGRARLRIESLTFGIGIALGDEKIVEANLQSSISPIAESLPAIDFNVTVENLDRYYNVDSDDSAIQYMTTGQQMDVHYGYRLDDGSVEWVKGGTLYLKDWSANDKTAKFSAVDGFAYMDDDYKRGRYYPEGISLYDLAEDVLRDAGIDADNYWIDPHLKKTTVYNPLPVVSHKECLQLIANAGRSVIMQGRDGEIIIKTSYIPDVEIAANQVADYGDIKSVLKEQERYVEYAAYEQNFIRADGAQYFLPRGENYVKTGYVSESISNADGVFESNPIITLTMETAYTFYNLHLFFGSVWPEEFVIRTYNNGALKGIYRSKGVKQQTLVTNRFLDVDKIEIEFTKTKPYNRLHLNRIELGEATDYELTYDDMTSPPDGTKLEKIKEMRVTRTIYTKGTDLKDLTSDKVVLSADQKEFAITFSNAVHNLSARCLIDDNEVDYGTEITEQGTYYCKVRITKPPSEPTEVELQIRGYEYEISTAMSSVRLNNNGVIKTWDNPLVSSEEDATNLAEWVGEYFAGGNEYKINYRGDPVLDGNDLVYLESRAVDKLMVRLEEVTLKYNGSLSGSLTARRRKK